MIQQSLINTGFDYSLNTTPPEHLRPVENPSQLEGIQSIPYQRELDREIEQEVTALRWVVDDDLGQYLESNIDRTVELPESYSALESFDWDPYVARVDGRVYRYGWGIDRKLMEAALRVLTGGGRFDPQEYTLFGCGVKPFVLTGPEGTVLGSVGLVGKPSKEALIPERTVNIRGTPVTVAEDSRAIIEGVKRAIPLVEDLIGRSLTFSNRGSNWWWFTDSAGTSVRVSNDDLATLGRSQPSVDEIPVFEGGILLPTESWRGDLERYNWEPKNRVGETTRYGGVCAGFAIEWERGYSEDGTKHIPTVTTLSLKYSQHEHLTDEISLYESSDRLEQRT